MNFQDKGAGVARLILSRNRVVLLCVAFFCMMGVVAWQKMPREEDPRLIDRNAILNVIYPGADAEQVERLVARPIEEALAQVSEIKTLEITSRRDVAILRIELLDTIEQVELAWDEVEDALSEARAVIPSSVEFAPLDKDLASDRDAIVLAVLGSNDLVELRERAEHVQRRLLRVPGVSQVRMVADPGKQVVVEYDDTVARRVGISAMQLSTQLKGRNAKSPSGGLRLDGRTASLATNNEFESFDELLHTPILLSPGTSVELQSIASVRRTVTEPASVRMRFNGQMAVGLGIVADPNINVVELGERIRTTLRQMQKELAPFRVEELSFQPDYVSERLGSLGESLLFSVAIVSAILVLLMGIRLGFLVALIIPLVGLTSLAILAQSGAVLHQLSIAAMILSLGLLVDNAIVVAESVQRYLDLGWSGKDAALQAVRELALPLLSATGTTVAAFIPMLLSVGTSGDFTRTIPIVAILTLSVSYLFAVLVTPSLGIQLLRPKKNLNHSSMLERLGRAISPVGVKHPLIVLVLAFALVFATGAAAKKIPKSFFPEANRNQLVVEVFLPEGAHLSETTRATLKLERMLAAQEQTESVSSFIGQSAPSFYYNLPRRPLSPHFAHLLVATKTRKGVASLSAAISRFARSELPQAQVVPRVLQQGPPLLAPVEVRLYGEDLSLLHQRAQLVRAELRGLPGVMDVQDSLGIGQPRVLYRVDDVAAAEHGLARDDIALSLLKQTRGLPGGQLKFEDEPIDVVVRSSVGESLSPLEFLSLDVMTHSTPIPISEVAEHSVDWIPAAITRRDQQRFVTVSAHLEPGVPYGSVTKSLEPRLQELLPEGSYEMGGAVEGSRRANRALARGGPIALFVLLLFVMVEFNSFRRLAIVLVTIPLAVAGIVPGLLLAGQPFGFMSMLGIFALIGIVVNNAIVLLNVIDTRRAEGVSTPDAVREAVAIRTRPILLTTATTIAGLIPLVLSDSPLWPPMASAMMSGLVASTGLALFVVPALSVLLLRSKTPSAAA